MARNLTEEDLKRIFGKSFVRTGIPRNKGFDSPREVIVNRGEKGKMTDGDMKRKKKRRNISSGLTNNIRGEDSRLIPEGFK